MLGMEANPQVQRGGPGSGCWRCCRPRATAAASCISSFAVHLPPGAPPPLGRWWWPPATRRCLSTPTRGPGPPTWSVAGWLCGAAAVLAAQGSGAPAALIRGALLPMPSCSSHPPHPPHPSIQIVFDNHRWVQGCVGLLLGQRQSTAPWPSTGLSLSPCCPLALPPRSWFGIPSYHVQRLLSAHHGASLLAATVPPGAADTLAAGASCLDDECSQARWLAALLPASTAWPVHSKR